MTNEVDMSLLITDNETPYIGKGKHGAYFTGIVLLGMQPGQEWQGVMGSPKNLVRFVFELPNLKRKDGTSCVIGKKMNFTNSAKGTLIETYNDVMDTSLDSLEFTKVMKQGVQDLLGQEATVTVDWWEVGDKTRTKVPKVAALAAKIKVEDATMSTFFFNPLNPDMKVWEDSLTFWTKKEVMGSLIADKFPEQLHKQWVVDQQNEQQRIQDRNSGNTGSGDVNLGSIS